ncbi:uncharacterized protein LOC135339784 [Halichondria panicea]|uniref:uncharacterized protein LOC135339784 n=1 Tax=Halichondria panicea TaxID=6063 RepID=UPI00312B8D96
MVTLSLRQYLTKQPRLSCGWFLWGEDVSMDQVCSEGERWLLQVFVLQYRESLIHGTGLACANRHYTNPVGTEWCWKMDDADKKALDSHYQNGQTNQSTITTTRSSERNTRTKVKMRIGQEFEVSQDCVPELLITIQYVDQNQSTRTKVVESQQPTINNPTAETRKTQGSSVSTALQQLMDTCPLTTAQVNREVQQEDVSYLAPCFDNVELYVDAMKLTPGEQSDVQLKKSNHLAMIECLKIWRGKQRSQATFRALLEMLVKLRKGEIADLVCQYLKEL